MRKVITISITILILTAMAAAGSWKTFGSGVTLKETTRISQILDAPEKYLGQKVLVEGRVVDVCKKRGCWMEIASDKEFQTIRVKVNDGEIVFPLEAKGIWQRLKAPWKNWKVPKNNCSNKPNTMPKKMVPNLIRLR